VRIDDFKYRFIEQPKGWIGEKVHPDMPILTNLRLDPFERTGWSGDGVAKGSAQYWQWFKYEFWRFVFVQQMLAKTIPTFLDYPPMQAGASFNLDALKAEMGKKMEEAARAAKGGGD
jgi:arylsulfatase